MDTKELVERYGMDEPVSSELLVLKMAVRHVLRLQKVYFKSRAKEDLIACKLAERCLADLVRED